MIKECELQEAEGGLVAAEQGDGTERLWKTEMDSRAKIISLFWRTWMIVKLTQSDTYSLYGSVWIRLGNVVVAFLLSSSSSSLLKRYLYRQLTIARAICAIRKKQKR